MAASYENYVLSPRPTKGSFSSNGTREESLAQHATENQGAGLDEPLASSNRAPLLFLSDR